MAEDVRLTLDIIQMIEDVDTAKKNKSEKDKELEQKHIDLRDTAALRLKDRKKFNSGS